MESDVEKEKESKHWNFVTQTQLRKIDFVLVLQLAHSFFERSNVHICVEQKEKSA